MNALLYLIKGCTFYWSAESLASEDTALVIRIVYCFAVLTWDPARSAAIFEETCSGNIATAFTFATMLDTCLASTVLLLMLKNAHGSKTTFMPSSWLASSYSYATAKQQTTRSGEPDIVHS
jgi:hypothetical protein